MMLELMTLLLAWIQLLHSCYYNRTSFTQVVLLWKLRHAKLEWSSRIAFLICWSNFQNSTSSSKNLNVTSDRLDHIYCYIDENLPHQMNLPNPTPKPEPCDGRTRQDVNTNHKNGICPQVDPRSNSVKVSAKNNHSDIVPNADEYSYVYADRFNIQEVIWYLKLKLIEI